MFMRDGSPEYVMNLPMQRSMVASSWERKPVEIGRDN